MFMVDSRRAGFSQSGRNFYETEAQAVAVAEQLERIRHEEGARGFAIISPKQRGDANEALAILAEYDGADLVSAARYYAAHLKAQEDATHAKTVAECVDAYLADYRADFEKKRISKFTLYEIQSRMRLVRELLGEEKITAIDEAAAEAFLKSLPAQFAPRYRANIRTKLSQLFNFCRRKRWVKDNPVSEIKIKVPQSEVEVLSVAEARELLRSAEGSEHARNVVPYLAVSLFGGLRPFEAQQLRWEQIDFTGKQIEVRGETSKTRESRFVHIEPALAQWLKPFREKRGLIVGESSNFREALREVKREAGFDPTEKNGRSWPKDVLRHSYGTYWLAANKDRAHLAELMGNSISIIKKHYRRAIPTATAQAFWQIRPKGAKPAKPLGETIIEFPPQTAETAQQVGG
jgi:integrase